MPRRSSKESATTARQRDANRRNSVKSTGPKTAEGKARASRNGITHGVFARDMILTGEDPAEFEKLRCDVLRRLNPRDQLELKLVERVISNLWRMERVAAAERELYETEPAELVRQARHKRQGAERSEEPPARTNLERLEEFRRAMPGAEAMIANGEQLVGPAHLREWWIEVITMAKVDPDGIAQPLPGQLDNGTSGRCERSAAQTLAMLINSTSPAIERLHVYERRLEHSVQRCMNELRKLREMEPNEQMTSLTESLLKETSASTTEEQQTPADVQLEQFDAPVVEAQRETHKAKPIVLQDLVAEEVAEPNCAAPLALTDRPASICDQSDCCPDVDRSEKCKAA